MLKFSSSFNKKAGVVKLKTPLLQNKVYFVSLVDIRKTRLPSLYLRFLQIARIVERLLKNGFLK